MRKINDKIKSYYGLDTSMEIGVAMWLMFLVMCMIISCIA